MLNFNLDAMTCGREEQTDTRVPGRTEVPFNNLVFEKENYGLVRELDGIGTIRQELFQDASSGRTI